MLHKVLAPCYNPAMEEIWKPVPYKPFDTKYSVSNLGRVKPNVISIYSKNKAEVLQPAPAGHAGYLVVTLYAEGKSKGAFIHRMVTLAFHGDPPFEGAYACHKDDCNTNNRADNLYWGTHEDNTRDREERGKTSRGIGNGRAKLTEDDVREIREIYARGNLSQAEIARMYKVHQTRISHIVLRKHWPHIE